jgi:hypothetical protein
MSCTLQLTTQCAERTTSHNSSPVSNHSNQTRPTSKSHTTPSNNACTLTILGFGIWRPRSSDMDSAAKSIHSGEHGPPGHLLPSTWPQTPARDHPHPIQRPLASARAPNRIRCRLSLKPPVRSTSLVENPVCWRHFPDLMNFTCLRPCLRCHTISSPSPKPKPDLTRVRISTITHRTSATVTTSTYTPELHHGQMTAIE